MAELDGGLESIIQMGKLKPREGKGLVQGNTAN